MVLFCYLFRIAKLLLRILWLFSLMTVYLHNYAILILYYNHFRISHIMSYYVSRRTVQIITGYNNCMPSSTWSQFYSSESHHIVFEESFKLIISTARVLNMPPQHASVGESLATVHTDVLAETPVYGVHVPSKVGVGGKMLETVRAFGAHRCSWGTEVLFLLVCRCCWYNTL